MEISRFAKPVFYFVLPLVFLALSLGSVAQKSPTYDETVHLFAGYSYLKWGDYRVNPEHPPLVKMLAAAPLLALDLKTTGITPRERYIVQRDKNYGWVLAHRFVFADNDAESLFFYARLVMVFLAALLALCVGRWTWELYGAEAALVASFLFCFDPNVIAHSAIVQTDVPFALVFFAATYFFWRSLKQLTWFNLMATALLFAVAAVTKFSFVAIIPIWLVLGAAAIFSLKPLRSPITMPEEITGRWRKAALVGTILLLSLLLGYLAIWTAYHFRFEAIPFQRGELPLADLSSDNSWLGWLFQLCRDYYLLPEALVYGLSDAYLRMERTSYLLGDISQNGFWLYFPVAFLVKTPAPTLIAIVIAAIYTIVRRPKGSDVLFLLAPALIFFLVAVWSRLNVGWRHILPIYPFLFVWLGGTVSAMWRCRGRAIRTKLFLLGAWLCGSTLWSYPNYLAYFNEFVGGPSKGHLILVDSSLDWGQDLKALKEWMKRNQVKKIQLAYFGTADPAYYKINAVYLPGCVYHTQPELNDVADFPRYVAISETFLAGLYLDRPDRYARFRTLAPVAVINYSIRVYKMTEDRANQGTDDN
ncbi:MAG: ArnT family glycosyltransferase [Chloroflexota bacterium]